MKQRKRHVIKDMEIRMMNALFCQRKRQNRIEKVENREEAIRGEKNCDFSRTDPKNNSCN